MAIKIKLDANALELDIDTSKINADHLHAAAALSSAISLKRIADALEGNRSKQGIMDSLAYIANHRQ